MLRPGGVKPLIQVKSARDQLTVGIEIPAPLYQRREVLPWQRPKAIEEDSEAMRRVQAILRSPSYRPTDTDTAFLVKDDLRGVASRLITSSLNCCSASMKSSRRLWFWQYADLRTSRRASQDYGVPACGPCYGDAIGYSRFRSYDPGSGTLPLVQIGVLSSVR